MKAKKNTQSYVAFLRGINVGGHHKVPMAELRKELKRLDLDKVETILNSGNIVFDATETDIESLEDKIKVHLEKKFGFPIPTILRRSDVIYDWLAMDPFGEVEVTKDIRLYISLLRRDVSSDLDLPWRSEDHSFKILKKHGKAIMSVLDLSVSKTPKAMEVLERKYGKDITTRNWKTIIRIIKKLDTRSGT